MAGIVEYWNGIPVARAQPVLSDLQRWQARHPAPQAPAPARRTGSRPAPIQPAAAEPATRPASR